ncbi:MAG: substrate-binding domain-containing protein [Lachnospiraceae bacterium]|nr:substrate-binding domain-containing protein [Lachnospiraceae bacterium]
MKWNRTTTIWVIIVLCSVITYTLVRIIMPGRKAPVYTVSVIMQDSGSNRWRSFREGMNQCAADRSVVVNIVSTGHYTQRFELAEIIRREQANGADGLIVDPAMDDSGQELENLLSATPSVLAETGLSGQTLIDVVKPDGYQLGCLIGKAVLDNEELSEGTAIGVLSGNQNTLHMQECRKGFLETLGSYAEQIQWNLTEQSLSSGDLLGISMGAKPVDILVALDNEAMEKAIDFVTGNIRNSCRLYGQGRSEKCIYYLDQGVISTLVVPDEFMMGYAAMARLLSKLTTYSPAVQSQEIRILSVSRENLYDDETAGILFPVVS